MNISQTKVFFLLILGLFAQQVNSANKLFAFVGEKIEVTGFRPETNMHRTPVDIAVRAKYRVVTTVYGTYDGETIEFEAYDHHGFPQFAQYRNVLLFVSNVDGRYIHEKYQFFPVYPTANGGWASCGSPYYYEPSIHHGDIVAHEIEFLPEVSFSTRGMSKEEIETKYPMEYFSRAKDKAVCTKGNYLPELFEIKKNGVLKARGLF